MKKTAFTFILLLVLSIGAFAEGDGQMPGGGKTCPNGQTVCREVPTDNDFIKIVDWLIDIFS